MSGFPVPANEDERLKELQRLRFHEWGAGAALDQLCAIASRMLETPIALVSLVDRNETIFAGKTGLDADRISREIAFCAHTIMASQPLIVEDAGSDPRFFKNPLVTESPKVRAYLGIPLETSHGFRVGALCAVDRTPRSFKECDVQTLTNLSQIVVSILSSYRMTLDLDDQLKNAIALQNDMLPNAASVARLQRNCALDLSSYYRPLDGIGGDIWGIEATGPQRLLLYAADFTGHGVAAALNTARFHSFVHINRRRTDKPASMLRRLNQRLHEVLPIGQFATMFCATLDFKARTMEYASAGAPPQLYRRSSAHPFELLSRPNLPLGILADADYGSDKVPFQEGGVLVLYTDGVIETPKPPQSVFTPASLREFLNASRQGAAFDMLQNITSRLFSEPTVKANDDLTLIVARHTGEEKEQVADYEI